MDKDESGLIRRRRAVEVARTSISTAGAVSAFGFAGYATVTTDNELGTVAAFLTGVFFTAMAFTGRIPRIRHGEWELNPLSAASVTAQETTEAVREAVDQGAEPREIVRAAEDAGDATLRTLRVFVTSADADHHRTSWMEPGLTRNQQEVLRLASTGASTREIARAMSLSEATVKAYLSRILAKTGAATRTEAIRIAREAGWI